MKYYCKLQRGGGGITAASKQTSRSVDKDNERSDASDIDFYANDSYSMLMEEIIFNGNYLFRKSIVSDSEGREG